MCTCTVCQVELMEYAESLAVGKDAVLLVVLMWSPLETLCPVLFLPPLLPFPPLLPTPPARCG